MNLVSVIDHEPIGRSGTVCDPCAAALTHQRVQGDGHATRRRRPRDGAVTPGQVQIRLSIRDDEQGSRGLGLQLASTGQAPPEQHRAGELVDWNERDQQRLQLRAPSWKIVATTDGRPSVMRPGRSVP